MGAGGGAEPFTKLYAMNARKLQEAGTPGTEILVYQALTRFVSERGKRCTVSRPVSDIAEELGVHADHVKVCLHRLQGRLFEWNGYLVPILTRTRRASRGHVAEFRDNVTLYRLDPNAEPPDETDIPIDRNRTKDSEKDEKQDLYDEDIPYY